MSLYKQVIPHDANFSVQCFVLYFSTEYDLLCLVHFLIMCLCFVYSCLSSAFLFIFSRKILDMSKLNHCVHLYILASAKIF